MEAVQRAWYTECLIIDLTDLIYKMGRQYGMGYGIGWFRPNAVPETIGDHRQWQMS